MSNFLIALIAALGIAGWVYAKAIKRMGQRNPAAWASGFVGVLAFITMLIILNIVNRYTGQ